MRSYVNLKFGGCTRGSSIGRGGGLKWCCHHRPLENSREFLVQTKRPATGVDPGGRLVAYYDKLKMS